MPQFFSEMMQTPGAMSPTPFTPQMEQQYHQWRSQQIASELQRWNAMMKQPQPGGLQADRSANDGMKQKLQQMLSYYSQDTPALRAAYAQQQAQPR